MRRGLAGTLIALLLVVMPACTGADVTAPDPRQPRSASPSPTPTEAPTSEAPSPSGAPSPTPSSANVDLSQVPDEITIEYLDQVMTQVDRIYADAFQMAKEAGRAEDPSVVELLSTIYVPATALGNAQTFDEFVGVELLADDIRPPTTEVSEILDETDTCVLVRASVDLTPLVNPEADVHPSDAHYIQLVRAPATSQARLPWLLGYSSALSDSPPRTCADADQIRTEGR